jgi:hypothetical protein
MMAHRVILIAGTAMLAVATSRIAQHVSDEGSWVLAVGAGFVMYGADALGAAELESEQLRRSTPGRPPKDRDATRMDMFRYRAPRLTLQVLLIGIALILLGLAWPAFG